MRMESAQLTLASHILKSRSSVHERKLSPQPHSGQTLGSKPNQDHAFQVGTVHLYGVPIVSLVIESQERLCLAQISNTLLKQFSYNEIHNRRVALGITCVQCTPVQLEILRRAGAMPVSSRRCGMITRREAERLCKSFLGDNAPPRLPDDFAFSVHHECAWGCRGAFLPSRYNSSRAKCIKCSFCGLFFSPNKFIFHSHRTGPGDKYVQPDAANFNSWRRHMKLSGGPPDEVVHAWEDVKAMFNGGTRKRLLSHSRESTPKQMKPSNGHSHQSDAGSPVPCGQSPLIGVSTAPPHPSPAPSRLPVNFPLEPLSITRGLSVMDYMWQKQFQFPSAAYTALPWLKRPVFGAPMVASDQTALYHHHSAFRPVIGAPAFIRPHLEDHLQKRQGVSTSDSDEEEQDVLVDVESTEDDGTNGQTVLPASPHVYRQIDDSGSHQMQATELVIPKPEPSPGPTLAAALLAESSSLARASATSPKAMGTTVTPRAHGQLWSVASLTEQKTEDDDHEPIGGSGSSGESRDSVMAQKINSVPFYRRDVRIYENCEDGDIQCDCSECLHGVKSRNCLNNQNEHTRTRV